MGELQSVLSNGQRALSTFFAKCQGLPPDSTEPDGPLWDEAREARPSPRPMDVQLVPQLQRRADSYTQVGGFIRTGYLLLATVAGLSTHTTQGTI